MSGSSTAMVRVELVARLRAAYGNHIGDPDWEEDIRRLSGLSPEFAGLWARHPEVSREGFERLAASLVSGGFISKTYSYEDCVDQSLN